MGIKNFFKNLFNNLFNAKEVSIEEKIEKPKKKKETKAEKDTKTSKPKTKKSFGEKIKEGISKLKPKKEKEPKVKVPKAKKPKAPAVPEYEEMVSQNIEGIFEEMLNLLSGYEYGSDYYQKIKELYDYFKANKNKFDDRKVDYNYIYSKLETLEIVLYNVGRNSFSYAQEYLGIFTAISQELLNGFEDKEDFQFDDLLWYETEDIDF